MLSLKSKCIMNSFQNYSLRRNDGNCYSSSVSNGYKLSYRLVNSCWDINSRNISDSVCVWSNGGRIGYKDRFFIEYKWN